MYANSDRFYNSPGPYLEDVVVVDVRVLALVERHEPRVVELFGLRVDVRVAVVAQPATRPRAAECQVVGHERLVPVSYTHLTLPTKA